MRTVHGAPGVDVAGGNRYRLKHLTSFAGPHYRQDGAELLLLMVLMVLMVMAMVIMMMMTMIQMIKMMMMMATVGAMAVMKLKLKLMEVSSGKSTSALTATAPKRILFPVSAPRRSRGCRQEAIMKREDCLSLGSPQVEVDPVGP